MLELCDINEYVLIKIFEYCSETDLDNLYFVCTLFQNIIEKRIFYKKSSEVLLCGHRNNPVNCQRTIRNLTNQQRLKINGNWINGKYEETVFFHHKKFYPSKIFIEKDLFYMTHFSTIKVHKRGKREILDRKYLKEISSDIKTDISSFTKKGDTIFAGRTCGNCFIYENDYLTEQRLHDYKEYLTAVDFSNNIFVTSSDKTSKLWAKNIELGLINFELIQDYKESYKCLKISKNGDNIICGKYTDKNRRALREIDLETGIKKILNSNVLSIYDVLYKDDQTIFTANFDSTFRLFDKRSNCDEQVWMDPYDSSIYCLEYDGLYGVLCGMKHHCRVNLYDIRVPKKFMQMYFPSLRRMQGSPVYSLTCDCQYLFLATAHNLRVLDYKADWAAIKDYRNIFVNDIVI